MNHGDQLICPKSGEEVVPLKIWESRLPDGKTIRYGPFHQHFHWGQECEWSYMVQALSEQEEQGAALFI